MLRLAGSPRLSDGGKSLGHHEPSPAETKLRRHRRRSRARGRSLGGTELYNFRAKIEPRSRSKYPPAEPGALGSEPLKAAISGDSLPSLTSGPFSLNYLEQTI